VVTVWSLVQLPSRDLMLNDFFTKKTQMVTALKNVEDMMKLKRLDCSTFVNELYLWFVV